MSRLCIRLLMSAIRSRPSPEIVVVGICILLLLAVGGPALLQFRERARAQQTQDQMRQLGVAMQNYHETFRSFPANETIHGRLSD